VKIHIYNKNMSEELPPIYRIDIIDSISEVMFEGKREYKTVRGCLAAIEGLRQLLPNLNIIIPKE